MHQADLQLRWGICGAGNVSHDFSNELLTLPAKRQKIVAVACRDAARARSFAHAFNIEKAYDSYDSLASDCDVNAVYVGTLNSTHYELCRQFLQNGKHVLCEKSLCNSPEEAQDLQRLANSKRLFLMEAIKPRCLPAYGKLKQLVRSGVLGRVQAVEGRIMGNYMHLERVNSAALGGGVCRYVGMYALQFAEWVMESRPSRIHAVGTMTGDVESSVALQLQYDAGRFATFLLSAGLHGTMDNGDYLARVYGDKGCLTVGPAFGGVVRTITMCLASGDTQRFTFDDDYQPLAVASKNPFTHGLRFEAQHVYQCIEQGLLESPLVPLSLSIWMQQAFDEMKRQLRKPECVA